MPQINGETWEDTNGVFTRYTGTANSTSQNFTFTTEQHGMAFINKSSFAISLTINGTKNTVPPRSTIQVDDEGFSSFDVKTVTGTGAFELTSYTKKSNGGSIDTQALADITSQLAQKPSYEEARLKAIKLELEDMSNTVISAVTGGATVNVLSIPQDTSVTPRKTTFIIATDKNIYNDDLYVTQLFLDYVSLESRTTTGYTTGVASVVIPLELGVTYKILKKAAPRFRVAVFNQPPLTAGINAITTLTNEIIAPAVTEVTYTAQSSGLYIVVYSSNNGTIYPIDIFVDDYSLSTDIEVVKENLKPKSVSIDKTDFLVTATNMLDGTFEAKYIDTSFRKISENVDARSVIVEIFPGVEYTIKTFGTHNRFLVGLTNSITTGTVVSAFVAEKYSTSGYEEVTFINNSGYKYCFIYVSNNAVEPEITMTEGNIPVEPNQEIFVLKGKKIMLEGDSVNVDDAVNLASKKSNSYYWVPDAQPDALGGVDSFSNVAWTSEQFINNIYEPLRAKYPYYITRENIGKDATGTYDMWKYIFEPKYYEQTAFLQSGVHPWEEEGYHSLGRFMQILCDEHETHRDLSYLRHNVRFIVIPIVNVWGVSAQTEAQRTSNNVNGVNMNRDTVNKSQQETINVLNQIDLHADELSFFMDFHTTGKQTTFGDYMYEYYADAGNERIVLRTIQYLCDKNVRVAMGREPDLHEVYSLTGVAPEGKYVEYPWLTHGVPSSTVEHSDMIFDNAEHTSKAITAAVEHFGNQIIQHALKKFKTVE